MFFRNFKYIIKTLFKNKSLIFWTYAFPIILGTFFYLAFSEIENSEKLDIIDIAIVRNDEYKNSAIFLESFDVLCDGEEKLFNCEYTDEEDAVGMLDNSEIIGYLKFEDEPVIVVRNSGINETIFKYVTEEIYQSISIVNDVASNMILGDMKMSRAIDYESIYNEALELVKNSHVNIKDVTSDNLSYTMIEFYTLIAMACLYGAIIGMSSINVILANMSDTGKRISVSPASKFKLVMGSVFASYIVQVIGLFLLFVYTMFVLKVDYGDNIGLTILLSLAGCLAGLSLGIFVSSVIKTNENTKTGIIISVTMLWSFLSGMMGITMKYVIDKNLPILNIINPVNMITDGFYSLYYYETLDRYYFNLFSLVIFSVLLIIISINGLRRQKYDSI